MKILHVISSLAKRYGGPSKACLEMAEAVAKLGHEVTVYSTNIDGPRDLQASLGRLEIKNRVKIRYFQVQQPRLWRFSLPLAKAIKENIRNFDMVHLHSLYLFHNLVTGHYCRKSGIPYIIRPHGTLDPFLFYRSRFRKTVMELLFENRNLKGAAAIHFTTAEEYELAKPFIHGTPGVIVPHGLNLEEYETLPPAGTFSDRFPETKGKEIILFLGRINFKKGLDLLVPAFSEVSKNFPQAHLVIAGPDDEGYGNDVRTWLRDRNLLEKTTFTGMLEGPEKLAAFRDSFMFVLPSYSENFGISVVEAMACGKPVVISDKVNIWREVGQSMAGKVTPCDSKLFSGGMLELLRNPESAVRMGEAGKKLVSELFHWPRIGKLLESTYENFITRKAGNI